MHSGHQYLLDQVKSQAGALGWGSMVVTFDNHPRTALQVDYRPQLLGTTDDKLQWLEATGVSACALLRFTPEMSRLSAADFMRTYLRRLGVQALLIGHDHHFGHDRNATIDDYRRYGEECDIAVYQAKPLLFENEPVSSSRIRRLLDRGDVARASHLLTRPYCLRGTVGEGRRVGRKIGFPTANLLPVSADLLIPARGVYAVWAEIPEGCYPAMLNIGRRPTLGNGNDITIEAHLMGFAGNLYGSPITLHFIERLRDERQFDSLEMLTRQLVLDARAAMSVLDKHPLFPI